MWFGLRRNAANWLSGGAHVVILSFAFNADSKSVWPYALAAMSAVSFAAWMGNYRRRRRIEDTPTSRIVSAAQGYVELHGRAVAGGESPLFSPLTQTLCLWYAYQTEQTSNRVNMDWIVTDEGSSNAAFWLEDGSGRCRLCPEGGEVTTSHKSSWFTGAERYTEWLLLAEDDIYAIGDFATTNEAGAGAVTHAEVGELLSEWKREPAALKKRFDLDGDGALDVREWELARREARRTVEAARRETVNPAGSAHVMRKPAYDSPFLISNLSAESLGRGYLLWSWAHAAIFVIAAGGAFLLFTAR